LFVIVSRRSLFGFKFVFGLLAASQHPLSASALGSFTITESVAPLPSYYPAQCMTMGWAGIFLDNTSTPIVVAGFPISDLPTTPYTVALLPGDAAFDTVNTTLHQPNEAFNHAHLWPGDSTDGGVLSGRGRAIWRRGGATRSYRPDRLRPHGD
jgi:hypothetical protein